MTEATAQRCPWCGEDPLYVRYHDEEWGVPVRTEIGLYEKLCLEGQQAGLSWITVLRKRERYRERFFGFDPERVVQMTEADLDDIVQDAGVIRHRGKLAAIIDNARATLSLRERDGLAELVWSYVDGATVQNAPRSMADAPAKTPESEAMSKALRKAGFRFVGPTTCYAMMQACGLVNDHLVSCFRHRELRA